MHGKDLPVLPQTRGEALGELRGSARAGGLTLGHPKAEIKALLHLPGTFG